MIEIPFPAIAPTRLYAVLLRLRPIQQGSLMPFSGEFVHAALLNWLRSTAPADEKVTGDTELTVRQQILLLARFAFYCGIGYKTAMGMGQVRSICSSTALA